MKPSHGLLAVEESLVGPVSLALDLLTAVVQTEGKAVMHPGYIPFCYNIFPHIVLPGQTGSLHTKYELAMQITLSSNC